MDEVKALAAIGCRHLETIVARWTFEAVLASREMDANLEAVMEAVEKAIAATPTGDHFNQLDVTNAGLVDLGQVAALTLQHASDLSAKLESVVVAVRACEIGQEPPARH